MRRFAEVDQLVRREFEAAPLSEPALLEADALVPTAIDGVETESDEARLEDQFYVWVVIGEGGVIVASVQGLNTQLHRTTEHRPP
jgi:hypothetical protein